MSTKTDRRTFLKIMGTAGATAAFVSAAPPLAAGAKTPASASPIRTGLASEIVKAQPKEKLLDIYWKALGNRVWETKMKDLFVGGEEGLYGAFHLYIGEEGISAGVCGALRPDDYILSTHRGHGHLIAKGGDLNKMSAEIYMRSTGYNKAFGGSMHITDLSLGILGTNGILSPQCYLGAGAALAVKMKGSDQVVVAFIGESGCNSMYFWSGVRNAATMQLPFIIIVENNFYGIQHPMIKSIPGGHVSTFTKGLPMESFTIDGNDIVEVFASTLQAVEKARAGGGPTLIECMTYRWYDHYGFAGAKVGVDGAWGLPYRSDAELKYWMQNDPIPRYKNWLLDQKLVTEEELKAVEEDVVKKVEESIEFARKSPPPNPEDGLLNVYAEGPVPARQFLAS
jgi:TPP-dependent pyruvate/acetoin dehydrogenase alpha subunit